MNCTFFNKKSLIIFFLSFSFVKLQAQISSIIYVDSSIAVSGNGSTWTSAFKTLSEALDSCWQNPSVEKIYVAKGTYYPMSYPYNMDSTRKGTQIISTNNRDKTFHIRTGLEVYGGYPNGGGSVPDFAANITKLDGAKVGGVISDSAYHVVVIDSSLFWHTTNDTTVFIGFTVTNARIESNNTFLTYNGHNSYRSSTIYPNQSCGAIEVNNGITLISNNIITKNKASGLFTKLGSHIIKNNIISYNFCKDIGGGLCMVSPQNLIFNENLVEWNTTNNNGGGIYLDGSGYLKKNIIKNNTADKGGGAFLGSSHAILLENDFLNNLGYGSAVYSYYGNFKISKCKFLNNSCINGVLIFSNGAGSFEIEKSLIAYNDGGIKLGNGGMLVCCPQARIHDNLICHNPYSNNNVGLNCTAAIYISLEGTVKVYNNTLADNGSTSSNIAGVYIENYINSSSIMGLFYNNIFYNNLGYDIISNNYNNHTIFINNKISASSNPYTSTGTGVYDLGIGAINYMYNGTTPFVNSNDYDGVDNIFGTMDDGYNLIPTSSLIDIGDSSLYLTSISNDIKNQDRIFGNNIDIGCYEYVACTSFSDTINQSVCGSYLFNNQNITSSGIYYDVLMSNTGCDSTIVLNLTILNTDTTINDSTCSSYFFNNQNLISSGTYSDTLVSVSSCDSIITLNLTINNINNSVSQNGSILTSIVVGANYQWINCQNNSIIAGETNQSFNALSNGDYAVIITKNNCTDTSNCITVSGLGFNQINSLSEIQISPNPTFELLNITLLKTLKNYEIKIINSFGQKMLNIELSDLITNIDVSKFANGIYFLEIKSNEKIFRAKFLKK